MTTRYALPLVVPVVYLAVRGVNLFPRSVAMAAAIALGVTATVVDDGAMFGYGRMSAPAFRLLGDMAAAPRLRNRRPRARHAPSRRVRPPPSDSVDGRRDARDVEAPADASQTRVAGAREVLERRRARPGLVRGRSAQERPGAHRPRQPSVALSLAVSVHDAGRRRPSERDGLAHDRRPGLVSGRGMVGDARNRRDRQGRSPRTGLCADRWLGAALARSGHAGRGWPQSEHQRRVREPPGTARRTTDRAGHHPARFLPEDASDPIDGRCRRLRAPGD